MAEAKAKPSAEITENDRLMALLAYIIGLIVPLIILFSEERKTRPFQKYHAINSLGIWAASIAYWIPLLLCDFFLWIIFWPLGCFFFFLGFLPWILFIYYGIQAYRGKYFEIPVVTQFLKGQGWLKS